MGSLRVKAGYDGSVAAGEAIEVAAALLPDARAWVAHLWTPPFGSDALRRRLWQGSRRVDDFVAAVEREGGAEAERIAAMGAALARTAGWTAEPLVERTYGGEGVQLAGLAEKLGPALLVLGSRGRSVVREILLGSVAMAALHHAARPVVVAPHRPAEP